MMNIIYMMNIKLNEFALIIISISLFGLSDLIVANIIKDKNSKLLYYVLLFIISYLILFINS
jgi:hypothetical protein